MTDHDDPFDDLASAYLDGELPTEERARRADDAMLLERVDHLAAARDALRATRTTVDASQRDRAVTAALAAFEADGATSGAVAGGGATITPAGAVVRRRRAKRAAQLTGVAAVVALLALLVPFLGDLDSGSDDFNVAGPTEPADQSLRADASTAEGAPDSLAIAPGTSMEDLGPFADVADLASAVRRRLEAVAEDAPAPSTAGDATAGAGSAGGSAAGSEACTEQRSAAGPAAFVALAELDGRRVVVLVRENDDGGRTLLAFDLESCAAVASQAL